MAIANNKMNARMHQVSESQSKKLQRVSTSWRKCGASLGGNPSGSEMVNFESASVGVAQICVCDYEPEILCSIYTW